MKDKNFKFNGRLLKKCRQEKEMSRSYVCDKLNIGECSLFQWENNKTIPNTVIAYKLAKFYNMSIEDFIIEDKGEN